MENNTEKNQQGNTAPQNDWAKIKEWLVRNNKPIIIAAVLVILDSYFFNVFIGEVKPTLANIVTLVISVVTLYFFYLRIKNQDRQLEKHSQQIDIQIRKEIDDRFNAAINLLSSNQTSARTGAIFSLYQLAMEHEKYRKQVAQILCSHIRSLTQEKQYQTDHPERPSNEIQTTINLLFKDRETQLYMPQGSEGLYAYSNFRTKLPRANLTHAYLVGADFAHSNCQCTDFTYATCTGASFFDSFCEKANFTHADCQATQFTQAKCQDATFHNANCQGIDLHNAHCQEICFWYTNCQGAYFDGMNCQGGNFSNAQCQGADFSRVECQGAYAENYGSFLTSRIGQDTEFNTIVFSGEVDRKSIEKIENAKIFLEEDWYQYLQKVIKNNENKPKSYEMPKFKNIKTGKLIKTEKLQNVIEHLEKIRAYDKD